MNFVRSHVRNMKNLRHLNKLCITVITTNLTTIINPPSLSHRKNLSSSSKFKAVFFYLNFLNIYSPFKYSLKDPIEVGLSWHRPDLIRLIGLASVDTLLFKHDRCEQPLPRRVDDRNYFPYGRRTQQERKAAQETEARRGRTKGEEHAQPENIRATSTTTAGSRHLNEWERWSTRKQYTTSWGCRISTGDCRSSRVVNLMLG